MKPWKILQSTDVSPSKWFPIVKDLVELPSGTQIEYFKTTLPDVVMIVALTKAHEIIFVRQYKHGIGEEIIEFPAGRIDPGHTPRESACRELLEETGIDIQETELIALGTLRTEPSKSTVRVYGFLVQNVEINSEQHLEETESIEVLRVPIKDMHELLGSDKLQASDTVALLCLAQNKFPDLFR